MAKRILYGNEARKALKVGIDEVASVVLPTIGPDGRNIMESSGFGSPTTHNDGITGARAVVLKDPFAAMGSEIPKEAAQKTNEEAGDGTSTTIALVKGMSDKGVKSITMGVNALGVKNGMNKASNEIIEVLKTMSRPIKGDEDMLRIATISAESPEIGKIIADIVKKVGGKGTVSVDEGQTGTIVSEMVEGIEFERGYISPHFVNNKEKKLLSQYKNVPILVTDETISSVESIIPVLEAVMARGHKSLVIIAEDVVGDALATMIVNTLRGIFGVLAIKAPGFGDRKKDYLQDIAVTVGATLISKELGKKLEETKFEDLGSADKVESSRDKTVIAGGNGNPDKIKERIESAKIELSNATSKHDKDKINERIAKLSGGVAVIKVGAPTESEMKYLKLKVEDAVNATQAAIEEGVVIGGGVALIRAANIVSNRRNGQKGSLFNRIKNIVLRVFNHRKVKFNRAEDIGFDIVLKSVESPFQHIVENGGKHNPSALIRELKNHSATSGYDALNDVIVEDMFDSGIIDALKVTRCALKNASSAVSTYLTTEVAIVEEPKA